MPKLHYNAPAILTFSILALAVHLLPFFGDLFKVPGRGNFSLFNPLDYVTLFTHVLGHGGWEHLFGNLTFILLLGPMMEKDHGSGQMTVMIFATALATGLVNILISPHYLMGASGIVFMLIVLSSIVEVRKGKIPLTFILIAFIFIGKEITDAVLQKDDSISQMAHIVGGIVGTIFGFNLRKD